MEEEVAKKQKIEVENMARQRDLAVADIGAEECVMSMDDTATGTIYLNINQYYFSLVAHY